MGRHEVPHKHLQWTRQKRHAPCRARAAPLLPCRVDGHRGVAERIASGVREIQTPAGLLPRAGFGWRAFAALTDLSSAGVLMLPVLLVATRFWETVNGILISLLLPLPFVYALLAGREVVPSIGNWTAGIRRFHYSQLPGYEGSGAEFVKEAMVAPPRLVRVISVWIALYASAALIDWAFDLWGMHRWW